jgi:hypothetical protein
MHIGSVANWDVFGSMVFWCACPGSIFISNNLVYRSAYPSGTLAFPIDIPWVYSAGYSYCDLGMAWKNVASFFTAQDCRDGGDGGDGGSEESESSRALGLKVQLLAKVQRWVAGLE